MDTINKKRIALFFSILLAVMAGAYIINVISTPKAPPLKPVDETAPATYVTVRDSEGNVILETGIPVHEKDEYISDTNIHYIIISVSGNQAVARVKKNQVSLNQEQDSPSGFLAHSSAAIPAQGFLGGRGRHMVIYHTHSDECYLPTSQVLSRRGNGDIYKVGEAFRDALEMGGISTTHSYNKHDPHNINAYSRSRRTVFQLLKERPDAVFDVHRDSAPRDAYLSIVNGVEIGRVMIVIGRSNPNMQTNLAYAKRIKAKADELHPGLMRGIFMGMGDYNQDLYPTALLFEVGTENSTQDEAEKSIRCLADAIIRVPIK
ncbi:MAG: stage II sporulation protein P [Syntrophomonadaceae bacterium]|nr:stage II sporulation protein P [Syntrophomonadaceae bacterium]